MINHLTLNLLAYIKMLYIDMMRQLEPLDSQTAVQLRMADPTGTASSSIANG
jgi:hypothetical protein